VIDCSTFVGIVVLVFTDGNSSEDMEYGGSTAVPKYCNKLKVFEEETYALLRVRLEEKLALDWPSEF
jgi:hypothetical protein